MKNKEHLIGNVTYIVDTSLDSTRACQGCVFNDKSNYNGSDTYKCDQVSHYTNGAYKSCPTDNGGQWIHTPDNYEIY